MSCPRICIDDMCRGNRDFTLCGGSYCYECDELTVDSSICQECHDSLEEDEIEFEAKPNETTNCLALAATRMHLNLLRLPSGEMACMFCRKPSGSNEVQLPKVKEQR